jgi:hypothetical protein
MKLSDFHTVSAPETIEQVFAYPRSDLAEPAITVEEARAAETAICCWHNGRIKTEPTQSDIEGRVYLCPIGRQYWRYSKQSGALKLPPLRHR